MKKTILISLLLCFSLMTACSTRDASPEAPAVSPDTTASPAPPSIIPQPETTTEPEITTEPEASSEPVLPAANILPVETGIQLENPDNCTLRVSIQQGDMYLDDSGVMRMKATVYFCDLYDMVAVTGLKAGDTLCIRGQSVVVDTVEKKDASLLVNGEYTLMAGEGGTFYDADGDGAMHYHPVGQVTLRVSDMFTYTDRNGITWYPGDFLIDDPGIEYDFAPENTTVVVENGMAVAMTQQ